MKEEDVDISDPGCGKEPRKRKRPTETKKVVKKKTTPQKKKVETKQKKQQEKKKGNDICDLEDLPLHVHHPLESHSFTFVLSFFIFSCLSFLLFLLISHFSFLFFTLSFLFSSSQRRRNNQHPRQINQMVPRKPQRPSLAKDNLFG